MLCGGFCCAAGFGYHRRVIVRLWLDSRHEPLVWEIFPLKEGVGETAAVTLNYGAFAQTTVDFIIIAYAIFIMVKGLNSLKKKAEEQLAIPAEPPAQEKLLAEIRDLLKGRTS
ncbi:MAG: MscL family protein [Lysobacterales bacterium]